MIAALVNDHEKIAETGKGPNVFESASILNWIVEGCDTDKFGLKDKLVRIKFISCIFFGNGGKL